MPEDIFNKFVLAWILLGLVVFVVNLKIIVPYGRHVTTKWGPLVNSRLAWIIMESPVFFIVLYFVLTNSTSLNYVSWILAFLFLAHYFHRTFIFPFRIAGSTKKMPVSVIFMAIVFNLFNGFFIGYYLGNYANYELSWLYSLPFILGLLVFAVGAYINLRADSILLNLRDDDFAGYRIPHGFLFGKISCPNHFGEMIEWTGYALMSFNLPALAFAIWTIANLIPRAIAHHNWYKRYFADYPTNRKAVIPGLW